MSDPVLPKVLVVDDLEDNRLVVKSLLRKEKIEVLEAASGEEGVRIAQEKRPELIIMDLMMPEMNGFEATSILHQDPRTSRIPIVVLTALNGDEDKLRAIEAGAIEFLTKPFDKMELRQRIRTLLRLHGTIREYEQELEELNAHLESKVAQKSQALIRQYRTDASTGLPNKIALNEHLKNCQGGLMLQIELVNLEDLLAFYGHGAGEMLMAHLTYLLESVCRHHHAKLFRFSDETFFIHAETGQAVAFQEMATHILDKVATQAFSPAEGISVYPRIVIGGAEGHDATIQMTTMALLYAKRDQKSYHLHDENSDLATKSRANLMMIQTIREAIANRRVLPHYQPIITLADGSINKYECLMRLHDGEGNLIMPGDFLPVAMRSGLYTELTAQMLAKAFETCLKREIPLSLNLSFHDILDSRITDEIFSNLKQLPPGRCTFEILESEGIANYTVVADFIRQLHGYGARASIDDFGSGYSNFGHLMELEIDCLKIDGSLIRHMDQNPAARRIVGGIVEFAQTLGLKTVAEFVHSKAIAEIVAELGIDMGQGYWYGKPVADI